MEDYQLTFIEDAFKDVQSAESFASTIAMGGNLPDYFYLRKDGMVNYSEPNIGMILLVVSWGFSLKIPWTQAIQQIIPLDEHMTIKGDLAKALIFSRGKVEHWTEKIDGKIENQSYKHTIIASNGITQVERSFSIWEAREKGLYPSSSQLNGPHKGKWLQSPWYKYPERMCMYRALGFIARDLWPHILGGLIFFEEVSDYPDMKKIVVEREEGDLTIDNSSGKRERSDNVTHHAVEKIDKNDKKSSMEDVSDKARKIIQETAREPLGKNVFAHSNKDKYTEDDLQAMGSDIEKVADQLGILDIIRNMDGRNTNKKIRTAIMFYQHDPAGFADMYGAPEGTESSRKEYQVPEVDPQEEQEPEPEQTPEQEEDPAPTEEQEPEDEQQDDNIPTVDGDSDINDIEDGIRPPEEGFEKDVYNKHWDIKISAREEDGERTFETLSVLYRIMTARGIDDGKFNALATDIYTPGEKPQPFIKLYPDKETFCMKADPVEINFFINTFEEVN